jgi:hypothetical protein
MVLWKGGRKGWSGLVAVDRRERVRAGRFLFMLTEVGFPEGASHLGRPCPHRDTRHSSNHSGEKRRVDGEAGRTPKGERLRPRGQGAVLWQRSWWGWLTQRKGI